MRESPAAVIVDGTTGNLVPAIADGTGVNRLATDARVTGANGLAATVVGDGIARRLQVDAKESSAPGANIINRPLVNGSNTSLIVNGSATNVAFGYAPTSTQTAVIQCVQLLITAGAITFNGSRFLSAGAMTNGLTFYSISSGAQTNISILRTNEDIASFGATFVFVPGTSGGLLGGGQNALMTVSLKTSITLSGSTGDSIGFLVRDNLTSTGGNLLACTASVSGYLRS